MKKTALLIMLLVLGIQTFAQKIDSTALILIDIQEFYFPGGASELVEPEKAAKQAKAILEYFRKEHGLVVHIRHDFEPGGSINQLVKPIDGEKVFTKKEVNAFLGTGLNEYLVENSINKVVLAGMQTHMCLEAATRAAHDLGYQCTVIGDACATRDLKFDNAVIKAIDVHNSTLVTLRSYGQVTNVVEYFKN
ncbi:cysteine hydrolase family protein [Maribellus mangrovi]|uniref:cysteine hydrolase family protein n=1 Tax=Maribellus mangrovi TaxID=3133146 RepID=UPI0030EE16B9